MKLLLTIYSRNELRSKSRCHLAHLVFMDMFCMTVYVVFACICPMNLCGFVYMYEKLLYCSHVWIAPGKIYCELTGLLSLNKVFELNWIELTLVILMLFQSKIWPHEASVDVGYNNVLTFTLNHYNAFTRFAGLCSYTTSHTQLKF